MRLTLHAALSFGIFLVILLSTGGTYLAGNTIAFSDNDADLPPLGTDSKPTRSNSVLSAGSDWTEPPLKQVQGDDFNERAIFVHQDDGTYLDDMLFVAAIPAAVHWEGSTRFDSMIISDAQIRENGNLIGDYSEYLRKIEATPDIDFIGPVDDTRQEKLVSYFDDVESSSSVTVSNNVYKGAADIARYYWKNQRQLGTDTAVLAYVPDIDGGIEVRKTSTGSHYGQFQIEPEINSLETPWLRFSVDWDDPQADTDYRIGIRDPYALQANLYSNIGDAGHVNPTDNKLFDHEGYVEIGMSPLYSYLPYSVDETLQQTNNRQFTAILPDGDLSVWPLPDGDDHVTYEFGPVKKGQWIGVVTNWTYYNVNETIYRDLNTYIYGPGQEVGPEYLLEVVTNDGTYTNNVRNTPEVGYCYADRDGYYNVTIHPYVRSVGGRFHTGVYWGSIDEISTWTSYQLNPGDDVVDHKFQEYAYLPDEVLESVTNAAVVASLENVPLLYTSGGMPESVVLDTLMEIGIENLAVIDPGNKISISGWEKEGLELSLFKTDKEVFNHIYALSQEKGIERSLVLSALGGPWFTGAALGGAYHGAPVPLMDDPEVISIQNQATAMWWQVIQDATVFHKAPLNMYANPSQSNMEKVSDDFFSWISEFNGEFDPECGDLDGNGIPDNGKNWDYSDDVDVLVISPMNAVKPILDRAISGKASVGRITPAEPEVLWAVLNRGMLYWKLGFSQADNPEKPGDRVSVKDHWNIAGWTFNTYAHDDDVMDNDAGDQDDDDWCGIDDGGSNHLQYKTREDLPSYAEGSDRVSEYHTYYDDILDMLEGGTLIWSNHGHGHTYWMLETGPGFTGTGADPTDPKWGGPVPENGFVDPPLETTSGWDWYYGLDNIHSTFSTYQSCQVGGSAMAEYFLRMGGIGVIGGFVTRSLIEATIQSDRTTRGLLMYNMTFGEAHRWGQDETGCMYSLDDPGPVHHNYMEYGYPDDVEWRYGDTGQTILYGDPGLRILSPTLFISSDIYISENGKELVTDIIIMDQSGNLVDPDIVKVKVGGSLTHPARYGIGKYTAVRSIEDGFNGTEVIVDIYDLHHLSSSGFHYFRKTYDVSFPVNDIVPGNLRYSGCTIQQILSEGPVCSVQFGERELSPDDINNFTGSVYASEGIFTEVFSNIHSDGSQWVMEELNVSNLFEGDYYFEFRLEVKHHPVVIVKSISFSVEHEIYFYWGVQSLDPGSKVLTFENLEIRSTYVQDSPVPEEMLSYCTYEVFAYSEVKLTSTGVLGVLIQDNSSQTYGFSINLQDLPLGEYQFKVKAAVSYTPESVLSSDIFFIDLPVQISDHNVRYTGGMEQLVSVEDIQFYQSSDRNSILPADQIVSAFCEVLHPDHDATGLSVELTEEEGIWTPAVINVSSMEEGDYLIGIRVSTISYGANTAYSNIFTVDHEVRIIGPTIHYDPNDYTLDLTDIYVVSSYLEAEILPVRISIRNPAGDIFVDITNSINFFGGSWQLKDLDVSSILPEGNDYLVEMSFWADGDVEESASSSFTVRYDLSITDPLVVYDQEYDLLGISRIEVRSAYNRGTLMHPSSLSISSLKVFNASTDELLLETFLQYTKGRFYQDVSKSLERFGEGEVYVVATFATPLSGNYSVRSETIFIGDPVGGNGPIDDDAVEPASETKLHWAVIVVIILLVLVLIVFISILALVLVRRKRGPGTSTGGLPAGGVPLGLRPAEREVMPNLPPPRREALPEVEYLRPGSSEKSGK